MMNHQPSKLKRGYSINRTAYIRRASTHADLNFDFPGHTHTHTSELLWPRKLIHDRVDAARTRERERAISSFLCCFIFFFFSLVEILGHSIARPQRAVAHTPAHLASNRGVSVCVGGLIGPRSFMNPTRVCATAL